MMRAAFILFSFLAINVEKSFSKSNNLCDHNSPSLRTDDLDGLPKADQHERIEHTLSPRVRDHNNEKERNSINDYNGNANANNDRVEISKKIGQREERREEKSDMVEDYKKIAQNKVVIDGANKNRNTVEDYKKIGQNKVIIVDANKNSNKLEDYKKVGQNKAAIDGAVSEDILNVRKRRSSPALVNFLKKLFVKPTTTTISEYNEGPTTQNTLMRQNPTQDTPDDNEDGDKNREISNLLDKLTETLNKLDEKLDDLSKDNHGLLLVKIPFDFSDVGRYRSKRQTDETDDKVELKVENATLPVSVTKVTSSNNTDSKPHDIASVALKIDSVLKDVQNQITAIKSVKDTVSSEKTYKVGYIVASLETLELTLKKLISKINFKTSRSDAWTQNILGKVELSEKTVSNLMDYLRTYTEVPIENKD